MAGFVIVNEDSAGCLWVLCRDGVWMSLESARLGQKPLATTVRVCRYRDEAGEYARRHTLQDVGTDGTKRVISRPRVLSARTAGIDEGAL